MRKNLKWMYDEKIQAGASFDDIERATAYDQRMGKIRNNIEKAKQIIQYLSINKNHVGLDYGSGTGLLTLEIAKQCKKIYAIDISNPMSEIAKKKAQQENINNIDFINSGFLSYIHTQEPVDFIISTGAFHHLPDFWKVISLMQMAKNLKDNGMLFLSDVIFSFDPKEYSEEISLFLNGIKIKTDEEFYNDSILHIKEEFSTFDWIIDEMLKRTGFKIIEKLVSSKTNMDYICKKTKM